MKKLASSSSVLCLEWVLMMATSALSQILSLPVLDTDLGPLEVGVQYCIQPAPGILTNSSGGPFALVNRNGTCPLYVGQVNATEGQGLPVTFTPYVAGDNTVRLYRDFTVAFTATTICNQSTQWRLGQTDTTTGRRLIVNGGTTNNNGTVGDYSNYFRISPTLLPPGSYIIRWCPRTVCPTCRFNCGSVGQLVQDGTILEALDSTPLPVQFVRA